MTSTEKQIAIATIAGWTNIHLSTAEDEIASIIVLVGVIPNGILRNVQVPDYLNSHNALLPVLAKMSELEWRKFYELCWGRQDEQEDIPLSCIIKWLLTQPLLSVGGYLFEDERI